MAERELLDEIARAQLDRLCWLDGGDQTRSLVGRTPVAELRGDTLELLDELEARFWAEPKRSWIGWLSYDLGAAELLGRAPRAASVPHLVMRQFEALDAGPIRAPTRSSRVPDWPLEPLQPTLAAKRYRARVEAAQAHIRAGDTYQVNLSQRFVAGWSEAARQQPFWARVAAVARRMRAATPASMGALIAVDEGRAIVSNSPETLLEVEFGRGHASPARRVDRARSWPIKGTRPRHREPGADRAAADELRASVKDLAEHVMIVDLVRNDLGALARPGTVYAPREPALVSLPTVHHLVSEVGCQLRPGWRLRELFAAMFPGGSITGAPKRRTVEIIDELEGEARGIYCGAIVLLEATGLRVSIPIRTGVLDEAGLELRSGGGIVVDSDPESERLETLAKARAFDDREWS